MLITRSRFSDIRANQCEKQFHHQEVSWETAAIIRRRRCLKTSAPNDRTTSDRRCDKVPSRPNTTSTHSRRASGDRRCCRHIAIALWGILDFQTQLQGPHLATARRSVLGVSCPEHSCWCHAIISRRTIITVTRCSQKT